MDWPIPMLASLSIGIVGQLWDRRYGHAVLDQAADLVGRGFAVDRARWLPCLDLLVNDPGLFRKARADIFRLGQDLVTQGLEAGADLALVRPRRFR